MIKIDIQSGTKRKSYFKLFSKFDFDTTVDFIMELFFTNKIEPDEPEDEIFALIETLGYNHIREIPGDILKELKKAYQNLLNHAIANSDNEKLAYVLLDNIQKGNLVLVVGNKTIDNLNEPVHLKPNTAITFYDLSKKDISFKTL